MSRSGELRSAVVTPTAERERQLILAAQGGDREAAVSLLERYRDSVYRFGMRMCQNVADAEDVLQETLLTAAQKLKSYRGEASFSSWLYAIARSGCSRRHRATRRQTELDDLDAVVDSAPRPDEVLIKVRVRAILERALATLDTAYREVLLLRDVEGLTAPEVADALGLSVPAVKSRLHRARLMLRDRVERLILSQPGVPPPPRCPDVVAWLGQRLEQELTAGECAQLETHLAKCADPVGRFDPLRRLLGACAAGHGAQVSEKLKESITSEVRAVIQPQGRTLSGPSGL
jgi:RNA polymerase sigma-70 factor (ECF subfamily)